MWVGAKRGGANTHWRREKPGLNHQVEFVTEVLTEKKSSIRLTMTDSPSDRAIE